MTEQKLDLEAIKARLATYDVFEFGMESEPLKLFRLSDIAALIQAYEEKCIVENSRRVLLFKRSPSGKNLFLCKACLRVSSTPDKTCDGLECDKLKQGSL